MWAVRVQGRTPIIRASEVDEIVYDIHGITAGIDRPRILPLRHWHGGDFANDIVPRWHDQTIHDMTNKPEVNVEPYNEVIRA